MINRMVLTIDFANVIKCTRVHVNIFTHLDERIWTGNKNVYPIEGTTGREQVEGVGAVSGVCV